jgi:arylsulfatase/uncharacterized sulfatase
MAWQGYTHDLENLGERGSYTVIGPEWASAAAGPSHLFKFHAAEGGLRVPLIAAGPGLPRGAGERGFATLADVAPTLLDLIGHDGDVPGAREMTGRSLAPLVFDEADSVYAPDEAVGFETSGQAALFRGDYKLVRNMPPFGDGVWRLFNVAVDPGESGDLKEQEPELFRELLHEYRLYANRVKWRRRSARTSPGVCSASTGAGCFCSPCCCSPCRSSFSGAGKTLDRST